MKEQQEHLKDLSEIRSLMEKSSRFLSLSGLSGVFAGLYALIGAYLVYTDFSILGLKESGVSYSNFIKGDSDAEVVELKMKYLIVVGLVVLVLSLLTGFIFTSRKAKKNGLKLWDKTAKRVAGSLFIPLAAGGIFCLVLLNHGGHMVGLVTPCTLIFYGLALLNASKYTLDDVKFLGISEVILGLVASMFIGYGLIFWAIGFGVLHIVYGALMYFKYERN